MKKKLLIVDDEKLEVLKLTNDLSQFGFEIFEADRIKESLKLILTYNIDILILDRQINSKEDGLTICREVRENPEKYGNPLIIIVSRKITEKEVIDAYEFSDFDFYIRKPYIKYEMISIIKKHLMKIENFNKLYYKNLILNIEEETLCEDGARMFLSHLEFLLLQLFFSNINKIVSKEKIYNFCWKTNKIDTENLKSLIYRIKKKSISLKENIKVQKYVGYILNDL